MLRLKKTLKTYKDFRKLFYEVWSESFYNYTLIIVLFFSLANTAKFNMTLNLFYTNIFQLSQVYE